jgi:hypothetical protein
VYIWALDLNGERIWGKRRKVCITIKHSCSKCGLFNHYGGVLQKLLLTGCNLFKISKSLLPDRFSVLQRLCYFFIWRQFPSSVLIKMLRISPVFPGFQRGCKAQSKNRYKMKTRDAKPLPGLRVDSWIQVRSQCFYQKQFLSTCYIFFLFQ